MCVFCVSPIWGPLTVYFELYPWNPLGILRPRGAGDAGQPHPQGGDHTIVYIYIYAYIYIYIIPNNNNK